MMVNLYQKTHAKVKKRETRLNWSSLQGRKGIGAFWYVRLNLFLDSQSNPLFVR